MIITSSSHGRTNRDCANLVRHLMNDKDNEELGLIEIGNTCCETLADVIQDMQIARDGSRAQVSLHHLTINPSTDCDDAALRQVAYIVRKEIDPQLIRVYALVAHTKGGRRHAHLVLGHVANGRALDDGRLKQRTELCSRLGEHYLSTVCGQNEKPVVGRHATYTTGRMRRESPEAASWYGAAVGPNLDKPLSSMSSATRQRAARKGLSLPKAKAEITTAWQRSGNALHFLTMLREMGYRVEHGERPGVFVVLDRQNRLVGALDRILKVKRQEIQKLCEDSSVDIFIQRDPSDGSASVATVPPDDRAIGSVGSIDGHCGRSDKSASRISNSVGQPSHTTKRSDSANGSKARRNRAPTLGLAIMSLRKLGLKIASDPIFSAEYLSELYSTHNYVWNGAVDIWNIPIEPKKYAP